MGFTALPDLQVIYTENRYDNLSIRNGIRFDYKLSQWQALTGHVPATQSSGIAGCLGDCTIG